ncbi:uncharacterized protein UTRI_06247 [Ustilago trichophora]|uniref:Uncharacterized protein n=1 Tax=Ustilago trichophora TaxID=86804 RepID=A0A5C3EFM7_9BASI|nr:uncharacterized protein UTRI_06247 [Ustilago trichophora]
MRVKQLSPFTTTLLVVSVLPSALAVFTRKTKVVPQPLPAPTILKPTQISPGEQPFDVRPGWKTTLPPQLESVLRSLYTHESSYPQDPVHVLGLANADTTAQELEGLIRQDGNSKRFIQLGTHVVGSHGMDLAMALPPVPESTERKFALISLKHNGDWRSPWVELHGFVEASNIPFLDHVLHQTQPGMLDRTVGKSLSAWEAFDALKLM